MRTSGQGSDIRIVLIPAGVLLAFWVYMAGGPEAFLRSAERVLSQLAHDVAVFVSART